MCHLESTTFWSPGYPVMTSSTEHTTLQASAQVLPHSARLVERLLRLEKRAASESHGCFAERLGRLFGLGDTMTLDKALGFRPQGQPEPVADLEHQLLQELADARRKVLDKLDLALEEFDKAEPRKPLADLNTEAASAPSPDFAPFLQFYLARQRQIVAASRQLRARFRTAVAGYSHTMARIAEFDGVFDHAMAQYTSQCFATLPALLEKRFVALQQEQDAGSDWRGLFQQEIQLLLLAELDVRLEPALGLLAAIHQEIGKTP
ncbi:hypothetical protein CLH61_00355 [Marinobacter profundi]|uniref:DUF3348 domain-containing protein n=2 Tax=Marinobacter profundi TaxID=2666256 RepID=A0A2G1URF8_9GAMM|nr:hypothetical protein CLH61_00355 [Marinobacter profundi]